MGHMRSWRGAGWRAMVLGRFWRSCLGFRLVFFWLARWHGVKSTDYA
jgi:hypothetical protein